jgi:dTDP-4-amino-4,6-dideoxygalactose transaminase
MSWNYPLALSSWDDAEIKAMHSVIDSGLFTMGKKVSEYEQKTSEYLGSKYSVMCSSGSTANLIMVAALFYRKNNPLKRGDEVIVPAVSWSTTYYPLYQYGLHLKFVDVDLDTLNFDLQALKNAVTPRTKLIMAVNLLGNPNNFSDINKIIKDKDIILLEDNCESLGATYEGKQAGTFGVMGTYSSFYSHHISTMEGGIVTTNDEELYHILLCLRAHGWTRNLPQKNHVTGLKSENAFEESFKFVLPGYNVRPLELEGAIGLEQLKKLPHFIKMRRQNADVFQDLFKDHPFLKIQKEIGMSSWFGFSFIVDQNCPLSRNQLVNKMMEAGIDCRPIVAGNFAKNEVLKWFDHEIYGPLSNADAVEKRGFFIGNHQIDMRNNLIKVKEVINGLLI